MFTGTYPLLMAEYNRFMNQRLYAACAELPDSERKRDRARSSSRCTARWTTSCGATASGWGGSTARPTRSGRSGEFLYPDFAELRAAREQMDQTLLDWAAGVTPAWLDEPMTWTSKLYKFTQTHPRWVQVVQMFNHQTHHRGQAHTLLTQMGIDIGPTDVPWTPVLLEA